jgi:hypothetical protein
MLIGFGLLHRESIVSAQVLYWEIEATVIDINDPDSIFTDVRLGDPVRGFLSYDLATPPFDDDPEWTWYDHDPATFAVAGMTVENPRDGTEIKFAPERDEPYVEVYTDDELDWVTAYQAVRRPVGYSGSTAEVLIDLIAPPDLLPDSRLPPTLDLNDWPEATIYFGTFSDDASSIYAEIHTLRSVDPPTLPGDFNGNRSVDASDYVAWRDGLGSQYTEANYEVWKANFGGPAPIPRGPQGTPVTSAELAPSSELQHFIVGETTYTQDDLIQPTLVAFEGKPENNSVIISPGDVVPSQGSRAQLLTSDFRLNTGILNPANGSDAATLSFSPPLVNGPGPDLVVYEITRATSEGPDAFLVEINSMVGRLSEWGPQLATLNWDSYELAAGHPTSLGDLENGAVTSIGGRSNAPVYGMAIDLDEFGVSPLAAVDSIRFGSIAGRESVDPVLIMGIKPEDRPVDGPVLNPGNGHWYDFVAAEDLTWDEAKLAAEGATHTIEDGSNLNGYLATVTSAPEEEFLKAHFGANALVWIGASDAAVEGEWRWVTGPEAAADDGKGLLFWIGGQNGTAIGYENWIDGIEPNALGDDEDYIDWNHNRTGQWNDVAGDTPRGADVISGYLVEFGTTLPSSTSHAEVPEPSSVVLCMVTLTCCGLAYTRSIRHRNRAHSELFQLGSGDATALTNTHRRFSCRVASQFCFMTVLMMVPAPANATLREGLIGYWPFDGNGTDLSTGELDLTIYENAGFADGLHGQALDLHGSGEQFAGRSGDDAIFDFGSSDFTVQIWVNYNSALREQTLIEKFQGSGGPGWTLTSLLGGAGSFGQAHFYADQAQVALYSESSPALEPGVWRQFVARRQEATFDLIYDGAIVATGTSTLPLTDTTHPLILGRRNEEDLRDFSVDGRLDEVAIWDRALTEDEIAFLYNGGAGNPVLTPSTLSGDFNNSGTVDAADYVALRAALGTIYSPADYGMWRANFGEASVPGAAFGVPEPTSVAFALCTFASLLLVQRPRHASFPAWEACLVTSKRLQSIDSPPSSLPGWNGVSRSPREKHCPTQTSCEGTMQSCDRVSGFQTLAHGASSCGA